MIRLTIIEKDNIIPSRYTFTGVFVYNITSRDKFFELRGERETVRTKRNKMMHTFLNQDIF